MRSLRLNRRKAIVVVAVAIVAALLLLKYFSSKSNGFCYVRTSDSTKMCAGKVDLVRAQNGDDAAQLAVAHRYSPGTSELLHPGCLAVKKDFMEAAKWYLKAARQGNIEAQAALAWLYQGDYGVKQDFAEAYFWILLALKNDPTFLKKGTPNCGYGAIRGELEGRLTADQKSEIKKRVDNWKPIVTGQGPGNGD